MVTHNVTYSTVQFSPKYLWFLTLMHAMSGALIYWFSIFRINVFGIDCNAGMLFLPFCLFLSGILTEVYGYKHGRRAIWYTCAFCSTFIFYAIVITCFSDPAYTAYNARFDRLLIFPLHLDVAIGVSYFLAQPANIWFMAKLKLLLQGYVMAVRFAVSTLISLAIGSMSFSFIVSGIAIDKNLLYFLLILIVLGFVCLPLSVYVTEKIKRYEQIDVYDEETQFKFFAWEAVYSSSANRQRQSLEQGNQTS